MRRQILGGLVLAATLVVTAVAPGIAQAAPTAASQADVSTTPADIGRLAPGTIIGTPRPVTVPAFGIPLPVQAWQLDYRSNDTNDNPIVATTTVLIPPGGPPAPRPLISYQAIINSVDPDCSPSHTLLNGTLKDIFQILFPLLRGWVVSVPDHQGPNAAYGAGDLASKVVLDGVRATENFKPAGSGLTADSPVGLWGYSGGGFSTAWTAEQAQNYAPELNLKGSAEGGVPVDFYHLVSSNVGGSAFGLLFASAIGLNKEYPSMDFYSLLNDRGKALAASISQDCVHDVLRAAPGLTFDDLTIQKDAIHLPQISTAIDANSLGKVAPAKPVLLYQSTADSSVPTPDVDVLYGKYCQEGATVDYQKIPFPDHVTVAILAIPNVMTFFDGRFANAPPVSTCPRPTG